MFANVIVDISVDALDRTFQYRVPDGMEEAVTVGSQVKIPFGRGNREVSGFVVGLTGTPDWPPEKMKSLLAVDERNVPVEGQLLKLAAWIRNRYGATMNDALKTVLPIRKQIKSVEEHWLNFLVPEEDIRREIDKCLLKHHRAKARLLQGMLSENGRMTTRTAAKEYRVPRSVIDGFVDRGMISVTDRRMYRNPVETESVQKSGPISLNAEQRRIVEDFSREYMSGIRSTYLLYGVTGSGKTQVYMEMMDLILSENRQVIVLIPEIALTFQTVQRFRSRFGDRVSILNSRMSDGERYDQYERAKKGEIDVVVGPRSALFAPFSHLGLIILDEEHEGSYKSENPPRYHAREVAEERARISGASVVLGSATPSVESYQAAETGRYTCYRLRERAGAARLPQVHVVDMREELRSGNRSVFSRMLREKMEDRLRKGEQTMLFLNRRGYAGFISCRSCGYVLKCTHCDISMTAHRNPAGNQLVCHYCGHTESMPPVCPQCGSPYIAAFGLGTQKVEEMLHRQFPDARILRMDGDTTTGKHGHEAILHRFREGEADILLGTQMIVKGHDFPQVTLVAALAADLSMNAGDFRSSERTFQLLMQASGRAGRGEKGGEMVIQTYRPEEYCIQAVKEQNAELFYRNELAYRRITKYPPYSIMLAILVTSEDREAAWACVGFLADVAGRYRERGVVLLGPAEAGVRRVKDRYRFVLYLKFSGEEIWQTVKDELERVSRGTRWEKTCSIQYDLNPLSGY